MPKNINLNKNQHYEPYRSSLLSKTELLKFSMLQPVTAVKRTLFSWAIIIIAFVVVKAHTNWLIIFLAVLIIGTQVYSLLIIAHDGLHRRLFNTLNANDFWNDFFILGSVAAITRLNRLNHIQHHNQLGLMTDPDLFKYSERNRNTRLQFLLSIICFPLLISTFKNIFLKKLQPRSQNRINTSSNYRLRDIFIILGWQIILIGGLTWGIGFWAYPVLWALPVLFAVCCDLLRVFCEHSQLDPNHNVIDSLSLTSYDSNRLELIFFAPNNMNHHIAHHLYPSIPFYNLPIAEALIRQRLGDNQHISWRKTYLGHIFLYWKNCKKIL
jgi:fatty acid desaturase